MPAIGGVDSVPYRPRLHRFIEQRRTPRMARMDRSEIVDAQGRHIPVTRGTIEDVHGSSRNKGRREAREAPLLSFPEARDRLRELAGRVRRLAPANHRNPHKFHEERSEIARDIERLAGQLK